MIFNFFGKKSWQKIARRKSHHQVLFATMIGLAVVLFWRGAWGLMDLYVFPDNAPFSYLVSLLAGLAILQGTHFIVKELT